MIRLAALMILLGAPPAPADERYVPEGGHFEVKFPGTPKATTTDAKSKLGKLKVLTATYATSDNNVFLVSYTDFPEGTGKADTDALHEGVRTGLKGRDGEILTDDPVTVATLTGRELLVKKEKQHVRMWIMLRGDRLYQVGVMGTPEFVRSKEADAFFKSFELMK